MIQKKLSLGIIIMLFVINDISAQDRIENGVALTPPMGWSSWNTFKKEPSEQVIKQTVDALVANGLRKAGYTFINIDDFWSLGRDPNGKIIIDSTKFPSGMKAMADYIHSKKLKAGIYTNIGSKANYPTLASEGYYEEDMKTFAEWGYDYVKIDVNFAPDRSETAYKKSFTEAAKAIVKTGRPMILSICNQGGGKYQNWAPLIGNTWRVGADIDHSPKGATKQWEGVIYELDRSSAFADIATPGHWNDADMMLVGVGSDNGRLDVMSVEEQKSHFSMWCMIASPLILGNDLRNVNKETLAILTNKEAIAINQDKLGIQGKIVNEQSSGLQVWVKKLKSHNGRKYAVTLFNRTESPSEITLDANKIGLTGKFKVRDVWMHKNLGKFLNVYSASVPSHGVKMLIIH